MNFFIYILHVGDKVLIRKKIISGGVRTWVPDVGLSSPTYGPMGSIPTVSHLPSTVSSTQINNFMP